MNSWKIFQFSSGQPGDDVPAKTEWVFDFLLTRKNERVDLFILQWKTVWDSLKEILEVCDLLEGAFLLENECSLEIPPHTF